MSLLEQRAAADASQVQQRSVDIAADDALKKFPAAQFRQEMHLTVLQLIRELAAYYSIDQVTEWRRKLECVLGLAGQASLTLSEEQHAATLSNQQGSTPAGRAMGTSNSIQVGGFKVSVVPPGGAAISQAESSKKNTTRGINKKTKDADKSSKCLYGAVASPSGDQMMAEVVKYLHENNEDAAKKAMVAYADSEAAHLVTAPMDYTVPVDPLVSCKVFAETLCHALHLNQPGARAGPTTVVSADPNNPDNEDRLATVGSPTPGASPARESKNAVASPGRQTVSVAGAAVGQLQAASALSGERLANRYLTIPKLGGYLPTKLALLRSGVSLQTLSAFACEMLPRMIRRVAPLTGPGGLQQLAFGETVQPPPGAVSNIAALLANTGLSAPATALPQVAKQLSMITAASGTGGAAAANVAAFQKPKDVVESAQGTSSAASSSKKKDAGGAQGTTKNAVLTVRVAEMKNCNRVTPATVELMHRVQDACVLQLHDRLHWLNRAQAIRNCDPYSEQIERMVRRILRVTGNFQFPEAEDWLLGAEAAAAFRRERDRGASSSSSASASEEEEQNELAEGFISGGEEGTENALRSNYSYFEDELGMGSAVRANEEDEDAEGFVKEHMIGQEGGHHRVSALAEMNLYMYGSADGGPSSAAARRSRLSNHELSSTSGTTSGGGATTQEDTTTGGDSTTDDAARVAAKMQRKRKGHKKRRRPTESDFEQVLVWCSRELLKSYGRCPNLGNVALFSLCLNLREALEHSLWKGSLFAGCSLGSETLKAAERAFDPKFVDPVEELRARGEVAYWRRRRHVLTLAKQWCSILLAEIAEDYNAFYGLPKHQELFSAVFSSHYLPVEATAHMCHLILQPEAHLISDEWFLRVSRLAYCRFRDHKKEAENQNGNTSLINRSTGDDKNEDGILGELDAAFKFLGGENKRGAEAGPATAKQDGGKRVQMCKPEADEFELDEPDDDAHGKSRASHLSRNKRAFRNRAFASAEACIGEETNDACDVNAVTRAGLVPAASTSSIFGDLNLPYIASEVDDLVMALGLPAAIDSQVKSRMLAYLTAALLATKNESRPAFSKTCLSSDLMAGGRKNKEGSWKPCVPSCAVIRATEVLLSVDVHVFPYLTEGYVNIALRELRMARQRSLQRNDFLKRLNKQVRAQPFFYPDDENEDDEVRGWDDHKSCVNRQSHRSTEAGAKGWNKASLVTDNVEHASRYLVLEDCSEQEVVEGECQVEEHLLNAPWSSQSGNKGISDHERKQRAREHWLNALSKVWIMQTEAKKVNMDPCVLEDIVEAWNTEWSEVPSHSQDSSSNHRPSVNRTAAAERRYGFLYYGEEGTNDGSVIDVEELADTDEGAVGVRVSEQVVRDRAVVPAPTRTSALRSNLRASQNGRKSEVLLEAMKKNFFDSQHHAEDPDTSDNDIAARAKNDNGPNDENSGTAVDPPNTSAAGSSATGGPEASTTPAAPAPASSSSSRPSAVTHVSSVLGRPKRSSAVVGPTSAAPAVGGGEGGIVENRTLPGDPVLAGAPTVFAPRTPVEDLKTGPPSGSSAMPLSPRALAMNGGYLGSAMLASVLNKDKDVDYNEIAQALGISETADEGNRKEAVNLALMQALESTGISPEGVTITAGNGRRPREAAGEASASSAAARVTPAPTMASTSALLSQQLHEAQLYVQKIQQFEALRQQLTELRASGEQLQGTATIGTAVSTSNEATSPAARQIQAQMTKLNTKIVSKDAPASSSNPQDGTPASLLGFHGKAVAEEIAHLTDRTSNLQQLDDDLREGQYSPEDAYKNVVANKILEDRDRVAKLLLQARDVFGQTERESLYAKSVVERLRLTKTLMEEFDETQELHHPGNLQSICAALQTTLEDYDGLSGSVDRVGRQALSKLHENMKKALQNEAVHMAMMEARQLRDQQQALQARSQQTKLKTLAEQAREAQMRYLTCKTAWKQMARMHTDAQRDKGERNKNSGEATLFR
ncbi:unnamed protein product [Amoebophrya sp. A25]|nr:unnamed protein product [Amoebophrya sp. A25]|eukprot:GSA25T00011682001.1